MIKQNIVANFVGQAWTSLMAIAFVPVYIHLLGMEAYGLIGFYAMLQVWLTLFDAGMTPTLARETARLNAGTISPDRYWDILRSIELILAGIGIVVSLAITAASPWFAGHWLKLDSITVSEAAFAITIMGMIIGLRFLESAYRSALLGGGWQVSYNVYAVVMATLRNGGVFVVLLLFDATPRAYFVWQLGASLVGIALVRLLLARRLLPPVRRPAFSSAALRGVGRFAGGMLAITVLSLLLSQLDKIVLSRAMPLHDFAFYTFAWSVVLTLLALVLPIINAAYPAFVAAHERHDLARLAGLCRSTTRLVALAAFPAAFTLSVWSPEAVLVWSNNAQLAQGSGPLITLLAVGFAINAPYQVLYYLQLASGRTRIIMLVYLLALVFYVPLLVIGIARFGALAAAWLWIGVNALYVLIEGPIAFRQILDRSWAGWFLKDNLAIAAVALTIPLAARLTLPDPSSRLGMLFLLASVGATTFVCTAMMLPEIRAFAKGMFARRQLYRS